MAEWASINPIPKPDRGAKVPAGLTVTEMVVVYWRHAEAYYRKPDGTPSVEIEHNRLAIRPLRKLYGLTSAAEFGPLALKRSGNR